MNVKYTNDGKKVIVIGQLNNTDTIVQEIFVTKDGAEIPSGENFVTKSLHDAPVVSWKEKELKELNERFDRERKELNSKIEQLKRKQRETGEIFGMNAQIIKNINPAMFDTVADFLSGEYKFAVCVDWGGVQIYPINDFVLSMNGYDIEIKLLSIFGKTNGNFGWRINSYRDDSGSWKEFKPCKTMAEAIQTAADLISQKESYIEKYIDFLVENSIPLDSDKLNVFLARQEKSIRDEIASHEKRVEEYKAKLSEHIKKATSLR